MNFLLTIMQTLGDWITKLAPLLFAYKAGEVKAEHDFEKSLREVLEEDNETLMHIATTPPSVLADELRERARKKRENTDKR